MTLSSLFFVTQSIILVYLCSKLAARLRIAWDKDLSQIPSAHWSAPYSSLWIKWQRKRGRESTTRDAAHQRHGPVVRLAPDEIGMNCTDGGSTSGWGSWDKVGWLSEFQYFGEKFLFSTVEAKPHATRKKMLASVYSKTFVTTSPELREIMSTVNEKRLVPYLSEHSAEEKAIDILFLSQCYFMDAITAYLYGSQNSTDFIRNEKEARVYIRAFELSLGPDVFWLLEFPRLTSMLRMFKINLVPAAIYESFDVYEGFGLALGKKTEGSLHAEDRENKKKPAVPPPVVFGHFREKLVQAGTPEADLTGIISAEMLDHLHAAHEASGILMTYVCWELSRDPTLQAALGDELRSSRAAGMDSPGSSSPLLGDILLETMRKYPPVHGPFPRVSPAGGGRVGGFKIPEGVEVSASPYTFGRQEQVFADPERWDPSRWSRAAPEARREMMQWIWAFGTGSRVCIGRHFAELTLKSMIATVYENFRTELAAPGATDMEPVQAMMAYPKSHELRLRFVPLQKAY